MFAASPNRVTRCCMRRRCGTAVTHRQGNTQRRRKIAATRSYRRCRCASRASSNCRSSTSDACRSPPSSPGPLARAVSGAWNWSTCTSTPRSRCFAAGRSRRGGVRLPRCSTRSATTAENRNDAAVLAGDLNTLDGKHRAGGRTAARRIWRDVIAPRRINVDRAARHPRRSRSHVLPQRAIVDRRDASGRPVRIGSLPTAHGRLVLTTTSLLSLTTASLRMTTPRHERPLRVALAARSRSEGPARPASAGPATARARQRGIRFSGRTPRDRRRTRSR